MFFTKGSTDVSRVEFIFGSDRPAGLIPKQSSFQTHVLFKIRTWCALASVPQRGLGRIPDATLHIESARGSLSFVRAGVLRGKGWSTSSLDVDSLLRLPTSKVAHDFW